MSFRSPFLLLAFILVSTFANAQFSGGDTLFDSEVHYPYPLIAGDIDLDGDIDIVFKDAYVGVKLFRNQGNGSFSPFELIYSTNIFNGNPEIGQIADVDMDGDGDLLSKTTWYRNNGPGQLFTLVGNLAPAGTTTSSLFKDIDGDGDPDYIGCSSTHALIILNNGSGTYYIADTLGTAGTDNSIVSVFADLNNDNIDDVVIGGDNGQTGWYAGLGGGQFGPRILVPQYNAPYVPAVGDMDQDGDKDIFAVGAFPFYWYSNDGNGNFSFGDSIPASQVNIPQLIADVDGDQDMDFSTPSNTQCNIEIFRNSLPASFTPVNVENFNTYSLQGRQMIAADIDGDGRQDIVGASGLGIMGWYKNMGNGTISQRHVIGKNLAYGGKGDFADCDLDGDIDLAIPSGNGDYILLFLNNNNGTFAPPQILAEHSNNLFNVKFADLNSDGRPDLITNVSTNSILWNFASGWNSAMLPGQKPIYQAMDADSDNDLDLISDSAWFRNDGSGNFTVVPDPDIPLFLISEVPDTADMNNDGHIDCVTSNHILFCNGAGDFTSLALPSVIFPPFDLGDMNVDGNTDIAGQSVYLNDGTGNIYQTISYSQGTGFPRDILVYDVDGDSIPDILNSRSGTYDHYIYVNRGAGGGTVGAAELVVLNSGMTSKLMMLDINNDAVKDLVSINGHDIRWYENEYTNAYRLRGTVFKDLNLDAVNNSEPTVPYQLIRSNASSALVWSNSNGSYDLPADTGSWKVWITPPLNYQITNNPDTLTATLTSSNPIQSGLDFGLAPSGIDSNAILTLESNSFIRCNSAIGVWITVKNTGVYIPPQSLVKFEINPDLTIVSFYPAPDSVSGNQYFWKIDSLGWFQIWNAYITINTGPVGSSALMNASLQWSGTTFFSASLGDIVTCAFDPNDKLVTPQGYGMYGAVPHTTNSYTYTIRFQNTGNDTAFTVVIRDALDGELNWSTLEILAVSHPLTGIEVDKGGIATFRFDQIHLPDSNTNEPLSHGFIKYRIQPKMAGTGEITNTAAIYFDQNDPVVTNTVLNTMVNCANYSNSITASADTLKVRFTTPAVESFQWLLNNNPIPGATNSWIIPATPGIYHLITKSVYGCIDTSASYSVACTFAASVIAPATILCPGSSITLSTQVYNSYQWYMNNVLLPGETSSTLTVDSLPAASAYFAVIVSLNGCSEASNNLTLYRATGGMLTMSCSGNYYPSGDKFALCDSNSSDSVVFTVPYYSTFDYSWLNNGIPVPGATSNNITVKSAGSYTCEIIENSTSACPGRIRVVRDTFEVVINANAVKPLITWNGSQLVATSSTLNNWQWYLDDVVIQGANSSTYLPTAPGNYTVSVSDVHCIYFSDPFPFSVIGLTEKSGQPFIIYPNPATSLLHISAANSIQNIEVYDLGGRLILSSKPETLQTELDVKALDAGIYQVQFKTSEGLNAARVVIQK